MSIVRYAQKQLEKGAEMDFFMRDGDEQKAEGAVHLDDVDLVYSKHTVGPWGPVLVTVAVKDGAHVCWQCGGHFDPNGKRELQPQEVKDGYATLLLHSGCVSRKTMSVRGYHDILRGLQARRFYAEATQPIAKAADKASGE